MAPIALELEGVPRRDSVTPIVRAAGLWEASAAFGGRLTLLGFDPGCGVWSLQIERSRRKVAFLVDNERPRSGWRCGSRSRESAVGLRNRDLVGAKIFSTGHHVRERLSLALDDVRERHRRRTRLSRCGRDETHEHKKLD